MTQTPTSCTSKVRWAADLTTGWQGTFWPWTGKASRTIWWLLWACVSTGSKTTTLSTETHRCSKAQKSSMRRSRQCKICQHRFSTQKSSSTLSDSPSVLTAAVLCRVQAEQVWEMSWKSPGGWLPSPPPSSAARRQRLLAAKSKSPGPTRRWGSLWRFGAAGLATNSKYLTVCFVCKSKSLIYLEGKPIIGEAFVLFSSGFFNTARRKN